MGITVKYTIRLKTIKVYIYLSRTIHELVYSSMYRNNVSNFRIVVTRFGESS